MTVQIHCEVSRKINFASHQCSVPLLRDLRVENKGDERIEGITVTMEADPSFIRKKTWTIDRVDPGGNVAIPDRDVDLAGDFLRNLTEAMSGKVYVKASRGNEVLAEFSKEVEALAYNEWGGSDFMPELLAAFSTPNDPVVDSILHEASSMLRLAGKPDQLRGYALGSRTRVWEVASAIYAAIAKQGLSYALPPTSFERNGQKIRLPSQVMEDKVATCLDSTMLFCSVLEQARLNPIIVMPEGHALVGVFLQPEDLASVVIDEAEILRKRVGLKELILIETTLLASHSVAPFSQALKAGEENIAIGKDESFVAAVDIARARSQRVTPLGSMAGTTKPKVEKSEVPVVELTIEDAPDLPGYDEEVVEEAPATPEGRLERWQRKLLDLTARNPLLNHRTGKTNLPLVCPQPSLLEDKLAEGAKISLVAKKSNTIAGQDEDIHRQRTGEAIAEEEAKQALGKGQLIVDMPKDEMDKRAVLIYRKSRTAMQEGGANTLYLAIGYLHWKRDVKDSRTFKAPLILKPVLLQRKSVRSGIKMMSHDDEPLFNSTLLEMLRKDYHIDIPGLDSTLPEDDSGVDVKKVWDIVRRAVRDAAGFEVVEDVALGHFSFSKYLMWKDLRDRADALRANSIVRHLIDSPRDAYPSDIPFVKKDRLDKEYRPDDLLIPLPADSSQMAAIATADKGKDFIIIGPPGTGKSQTISNMIAHLLGKGKKILFVSEKTAALDVVYRRLEEIGVGNLCLELHSTKANKSDVMKQLKAAWSIAEGRTEEEWRKEAERLMELRDRLNEVVESLHKRRRNGMTAHYGIGIRVRDEDKAGRVSFSWDTSEAHNEEELAAMREVSRLLKVTAKDVGKVGQGALRSVVEGRWTPQWEDELVTCAKGLREAASAAEKAVTGFYEAMGVSLPDRNYDRFIGLTGFAAAIENLHEEQGVFALEDDGEQRLNALEEAQSHLGAYSQTQGQLSCAYDPRAWRKLDGREIARSWEEASSKFWILKTFAQKKVVQAMIDGGASGTPDPVHDASVLSSLKEHGEAIDRLDKTLSSFKEWKAHATDPEAARLLHERGTVFRKSVRSALARMVDETQDRSRVIGKVLGLLEEEVAIVDSGSTAGKAVAGMIKAVGALKEAVASFEEKAGGELKDFLSGKDGVFVGLRDMAEGIERQHTEIRQWCGWQMRRNEAIELGLAPLIDAIEEGSVPYDEIPETFLASYCYWWTRALIGEDESLRTFSSAEHTDAIRRFQKLDKHFQELTADYIAAKQHGGVPTQDSVTKSSDWGIIRHEISKKKRHIPVRQLMSKAPDAITSLTPCLMMSPLSVAQYLPAEQAIFDIVIFDEASQITVWDAIGTLARGKQAVVVGDPRQMPPTNFFSRADDDPDGDVDYEGDLESILDEMKSAGIPEHTLSLHYRSRRESLIAFSNSRYYGSALVTFPAPMHPDDGVSLIRPEGFYARGGARHNEGEAKAVVAEIVRRLTSDDPEVRNKTIGVVTFNTEQQSLIEDLLDKARGDNHAIEWAFAEDAVESVFVKNLETVQGDERDVILFSVGYGPDQNDHVTMNFGPLNRDGGERRLNVALTRARYEMVVFSTLHPDRIDLSRTESIAVKDLKHFLEFAERGPDALASAVHGSIGGFESPFETAVAKELTDKGWRLHPQIGVSSFRIDIGVVHPDMPGTYLAGVECDGAMYHSSAVARERDSIRQSVLESLGWTLFRVWSTDWWINKAKATDILDRQLQDHLAIDRQLKKAREVEDVSE